MSYRKSYGVRVFFAGPGSKNQTFQFKTRRLAERVREGMRRYKNNGGFCGMRAVWDAIICFKSLRGISVKALAIRQAAKMPRPIREKIVP